MLEEHRHHSVAEALENVATLIGKVQDTRVVLSSGAEVVPGLGLTILADALLERVDWLEGGCLRLAVVGSVSRGKSTLINALLGEARLPVDMEACTGVITQIVHGNNRDEVTVVEGGESRTVGHEAFLNTLRLTPEEQGAIKQAQAFLMPERLTKIDYAVLECEFPLGEKGLHIVDTLGFRAGRKSEEITKAFLANTDALVFVTRAQPLFEDEDEAFLNAQLRLNEFRLDHIFFVINDFSRLDSAERAEVKQNARLRLRNYFLTPHGDFDEELFERRVFIVHASDALGAKVHSVRDDLLEATGLPMLERGIQQMLDDEKRLLMVLEGVTTQVVVPVIAEAKRSIQQAKWLLLKDLSELEQTQQEVEGRLTELTRQVDDIQATFNAFAQRIGIRAADHFEDYTTRMLDEWEDAWETMDVGAVFGEHPVSAALSKQHREDQIARLEKVIQSYFATRMSIWESEILGHLESDMEQMAAELEVKTQDFVVRLDRLQASMTHQEMSEFLYVDQGLLNKATEIFTSGLDSNLISGKLRGLSMRRTVLHSMPPIATFSIGLAIIAATTPFTAPLFPLVLLPSVPTGLLIPFTFMSRRLPKSALNRMRDTIGEAFREALTNSMPTLKADIKTSINERFKVYAKKFLGALHAEIEQVRTQLERTVSKKRAGEVEVTPEISRLDVIAGHLDRLLRQVSHEVYGRDLTDVELQRLRQGSPLLSEDA